MSRLAATLEHLVRALDEMDARMALIGGIAVSARCEPRFTRDVDVVVAVEGDEEAESIVSALVRRGYRPVAIVEQLATKRLATVRLAPPAEPTEGGVVVDLLFASSGIEPEIIDAAESIEVFSGLTLPVARVGHLVALKLLARDDERRPQDAVDLHMLVPLLIPEEERLARAAVQAIAERGYARGRALEAALDEWLAGSPM